MTSKTNRIITVLITLFIYISAPVDTFTKELPLNDMEIRIRLDFLTGSLKNQQPSSALWFGGWIALQSLGVVFSTTMAIVDQREGFWQSKVVSAVQSTIGVAGILIAPMDTAYGYNILKEMSENTPEERYLKYKRAEDFLHNAAIRQKGGTSWIAHATGAFLGISGGLLIWLAFKRPWWEGLLNLAIMVGGAEARIFTQPTDAIDQWNEYRRKFLNMPHREKNRDSKTSITFLILPGIFYASMRF